MGRAGFAAMMFAALVFVLWLVFGGWWLLCVWAPLSLYIAYVVYGVILLLSALLRWRGTTIQGLLVFADSPLSKPYIVDNWLPRFSDRVIVLNWSKRKTWGKSLPVRIFQHFGVEQDGNNCCPLLIRFRGLRYPFVYRYRYAFRDAKHGRLEALQRLEGQMLAQLEV